MSKEIPILFSTPMVKAILDGKKTMTRRVIKKDLLIQKDKYKVGDVLWVRETWQRWALGFIYRASYGEKIEDADWVWKPSIFMPKEICRIWLQITAVKIESLHDITNEDAIAEGIKYNGEGYDNKHNGSFSSLQPTSKFQVLWESINGKESWEANPFVFAVSFKVLSTTGKP